MWKRIRTWLITITASALALILGLGYLRRRRHRVRMTVKGARVVALEEQARAAQERSWQARANHEEAKRHAETVADAAAEELRRIDERLASRQERLDALLRRFDSSQHD